MNKLLSVNDLVITSTETNSTIIEISKFQINKGEQIIIFGSNGAGKSTFLKCFSKNVNSYFRFNKEASINLFCEGKTIDMLDARDKKGVSHVYYAGQEEDYAFGYYDSVIDALTKRINDEGNVDQKIKAVDIAQSYALDYLDELFIHDKKYNELKSQEEKNAFAIKLLNKKLARNCSSGCKKLIAILRAILIARILDIKLLVLDEPLNHLDYKNKIIINKEINRLINENKEISLLLITHCLIFDFINNDSCRQFKVEREDGKNHIQEISKECKRTKINCLEEC